jgi:hypothetical protein
MIAGHGKYNLAGCAAAAEATNHPPPYTALDYIGYDVHPKGSYDESCPSELVETYGPVMFQLLFFSNLLQPLMMLLQAVVMPAKKGQKKIVKKKSREKGGKKKKERLPAVLMQTNIARSFNVIMLVLTFGFVYPPVAIGAPLVMLGRQYCTQLLVTQEANEGHTWKYQGSTGLPLIAMIALLTIQCLFMFFFLGFGTLVPKSYWLLSLLPALAAVAGSMLAYYRVQQASNEEGDVDSRTIDPLLAKMTEEEEDVECNTMADPLLAGQGKSGMERYHSACTIDSGVGAYRRSLAEWRGQRSSGDEDEELGAIDESPGPENSHDGGEMSAISSEDSDQDQAV